MFYWCLVSALVCSVLGCIEGYYLEPTQRQLLSRSIHRYDCNCKSGMIKRIFMKSAKSYQGSESEEDSDEQISLKSGSTVQAPNQPNLLPAYVSLFIIFLIFSSNQWSRQALFYLCDFSSNADPFKHVNAALSFDKDMYAVLASLAFTLVFSAVSLFSGTVADNVSRKSIITWSCALWSMATILQGSASQFNDLLPLRVLVGFSQAFFNPAAYTLISDIFPSDLVGRMTGILSGGVYIGGGLASLSVLLDNSIGWRQTLQLVGAFGLLAAFTGGISLTDPRDDKFIEMKLKASTNINESAVMPKELTSGIPAALKLWAESVLTIFRNPEAALLLTATAVRFCAGFSIGLWKAPFVYAKFPADIAFFAGTNAAIVSMGGLTSSVLGGYISDKLTKKSVDGGWGSRPRARVWVSAAGSLLAAPLWACFLLAPTPQLSLLALLAEYLVAECWFGPTLAALFETVGTERRGTAQGLFSLLTAVGNFAPLLVGRLSELLVVDGGTGITGSSGGLGDALLICVSGAYVLSGILFTAAAVSRDSTWKRSASKDLQA